MHGDTSVRCVVPLTPFKAVATALKARLVDEPITSKECRCMLVTVVAVRRLTHSGHYPTIERELSCLQFDVVRLPPSCQGAERSEDAPPRPERVSDRAYLLSKLFSATALSSAGLAQMHCTHHDFCYSSAVY